MIRPEAAREPAINVGIGEMKVSRPPAVLAAVGIGSCVAVIIRDGRCGTGGMAHVMLPHLPGKCREGMNRCKYADYAIEKMVGEIIQAGGSHDRLSAKMVGGAHMFARNEGALLMDIGARNIESVRNALTSRRIPLLGEDTGGSHGRSVALCLEDGLVHISSLRKGIITI